jgi:hypothetical protein
MAVLPKCLIRLHFLSHQQSGFINKSQLFKNLPLQFNFDLQSTICNYAFLGNLISSLRCSKLEKYFYFGRNYERTQGGYETEPNEQKNGSRFTQYRNTAYCIILGKDRLFSIRKLTEDFLTDLQEGFPATLSTVFRTGDKLQVGFRISPDPESVYA